jgi:hypothetical protein
VNVKEIQQEQSPENWNNCEEVELAIVTGLFEAYQWKLHRNRGAPN